MKYLGGIIGKDGVREPQGEDEACEFAVFNELVRQQIEYGERPLIERQAGFVRVHVDIPAIMNAIKEALV